MTQQGLLIDYKFCTGCLTCEIACQMEHSLPLGQWGIKVAEVGPWKIADEKWQYSYVPVPTDQCDLCVARLIKGKKPTCVHHCQAAVIKHGPVGVLAKEMEGKTGMALFVR
jgi:anaerobic dimethyl sulfoxide reductase subunit B (iron-sulfur subunit)